MPASKDPKSYVRPVPLPIPSCKGYKLLARDSINFNPEVPTREDVRKDNYYRRQNQMSAMGFKSASHKPYIGIGDPFYLDEKKMILHALGQWTEEHASSSSSSDESDDEESEQDSEKKPAFTAAKFVLRRSRKDLNTLNKAVVHGRNMIRNVRLGHGLFDLINKEKQSKKEANALALQKRREQLRNEFQPPKTESDDDTDDDLASEVDLANYMVHMAPPTFLTQQHTDTDEELGIISDHQSESDQSPEREPEIVTFSGMALAETEEEYQRSRSAMVTSEMTSSYSQPISRRKKKQETPRPYTPQHTNLSANISVRESVGESDQELDITKDALFRQLCVLHWILEAMSTDPPSPMTPIMSCWSLSDIGGSRAQAKKLQRDKATENGWTNFLSKDASKVSKRLSTQRLSSNRSPHVVRRPLQTPGRNSQHSSGTGSQQGSVTEQGVSAFENAGSKMVALFKSKLHAEPDAPSPVPTKLASLLKPKLSPEQIQKEKEAAQNEEGEAKPSEPVSQKAPKSPNMADLLCRRKSLVAPEPETSTESAKNLDENNKPDTKPDTKSEPKSKFPFASLDNKKENNEKSPLKSGISKCQSISFQKSILDVAETDLDNSLKASSSLSQFKAPTTTSSTPSMIKSLRAQSPGLAKSLRVPSPGLTKSIRALSPGLSRPSLGAASSLGQFLELKMKGGLNTLAGQISMLSTRNEELARHEEEEDQMYNKSIFKFLDEYYESLKTEEEAKGKQDQENKSPSSTPPISPTPEKKIKHGKKSKKKKKEVSEGDKEKRLDHKVAVALGEEEKMTSKYLRANAHLIRPKSSPALIDFQAGLPSNKKVNLCADLHNQFAECREEKALTLHDILDHKESQRMLVCKSKFGSLQSMKHGSSFHRAVEKMRVQSWQNLRKPVNDRKKSTAKGNWYTDLMDKIPQELKQEWYYAKILQKLANFGLVEGTGKQSIYKFIKVLEGLREWEICSPDITAAIEFCRERIVEMTIEEYESWFTQRFPKVSRPQTAPPATKGDKSSSERFKSSSGSPRKNIPTRRVSQSAFTRRVQH